MIEPPRVIEIPEQSTAVIHLVVPAVRIREVMGPGISEVLAAVAAQGLPATGAWFTYHLRRPAEIFDFEVGVPVAGEIAPTGRVRPGRLPAALAARTVHVGGYEELGAAWGEFEAWIAASGHQPAVEMWEHYTLGPESGEAPQAWRTELVRPLLR